MGGSSIADAERELVEEFALFDSWVDRYQYIIDLGRQLPPFPEAAKTEEHRIKGCQSQVWLVTKPVGDRLEFQAVSDSAIVSGLIAILMRIYSGRPASEILATPPGFITAIGLDQHLSPTRSNGLHAMLGAIRKAAAACAGA
ncbi:MAG: SufE family protein [Gammaproteobacteria bacterium]|nr:SufE family protein [Gammaproteobacteria bacterium]